MKIRMIAAASALAAMAAALPVHAQSKSSSDLQELKQEVDRLQAEVKELKEKNSAGDSSTLSDRMDLLELKQKDAVVAGDIGGGFRLPGSETSVHLYGYAEVHAIHDFQSWGSPDNFTNLSAQPLPSDDPQEGRTKLTAETSRFGFETATPTKHGTFNTKIEADFYSYGSGNRNRLRLRHAYGEYAGFLVGQTWSTFMDVDDLPETVDFNGPIGSPFSRRTMVRYTWGDPQEGYKLTFAAEDPEDQFGGGSANEKTPELVARFDKSFDAGAFNVRALTHEKRSFSQSKRGFGLGVGGSYKLTDKDLLMIQVARVDGDVDQMYGSNGYTIDPTTGQIRFDHNYGLIAGYSKTFDDQWRANLAFGMNHSMVDLGDSTNRMLRQLHADFIYAPIKGVELGAEVVYGRRNTFSGETGKLARLDLMGRYSF